MVYALKIEKNLPKSLCKSLLKAIDKNKSNHLSKFKFQNDLQHGLFAELLIRKLLIEKFELRNEEICFSINEYGKPYCKFLNNFHFNISHSGEWVVCATDDQPLGIDIEKISKIDLDISKNFFSEKEHKDLMKSQDPYDYFFTLWTLKESYIKFIGKGLYEPLNRFSIRMIADNIQIELNNNLLTGIFFHRYSIDKNYKMATCSSFSNNPTSVQFLTINEIISTF